MNLNERALRHLDEKRWNLDVLEVNEHRVGTATVLDFGVHAEGGLGAGLILAELCMADLATVSLVPGTVDSLGLPLVSVHTDFPVEACLRSQYAGWKISADDFFAMGSGPMRDVARTEDLFSDMPEPEEASGIVGVLECSELPSPDAVRVINEACRTPELTLAVARTASVAGTLQVVARSVETAMHQLHEHKFPVSSVLSGAGACPMPPVAGDDLAAIGATNDAILYGSSVDLWVRCDDQLLAEIGPQCVSAASGSHGRRFLDLFKEAGHDFYKLDPALFAPAVLTFFNLASGRVHRFGRRELSLLNQTFGLESSF